MPPNNASSPRSTNTARSTPSRRSPRTPVTPAGQTNAQRGRTNTATPPSGGRRSRSRSRGRVSSPLQPLTSSPPRQPRSSSPIRFNDSSPAPMSSEGHHQQPPRSSSLPGSTTGGLGSGDDRMEVWGTTVNVHESMDQFRSFITGFFEDGADEALYIRLIQEIVDTQVYNVNINCQHLHSFAPQLYDQLVKYPQEIIPVFDLVVNDVFKGLNGAEGDADAEMRRIQVRTFNLNEIKHMRDLNPQDIDQMISIRGMVIRTSSVIPDLKQAFFRCQMCKFETTVFLDRGRIEEPMRCSNCESTRSFELIHNRCLFMDKQMVKLQEAPEDIPEGETPHTVTLSCFEDLVDVGRPGDRVEIVGIYRANPVRVNPRLRTVKSIYKTYIDVIHFRKTEKRRLLAEDATAPAESEFYTSFAEGTDVAAIPKEKEDRMKELSKRENLYESLADALAPSIWELDDVKKGVLCQLFGGTNKDFGAAGATASSTSGRFRGEINILMVGDPGTSKSQMLQYVHKIAPRGIYTSGKGSSAVGLTAYITKDPETKELVLESGALVLSDRGVCCIDEFDKMGDGAKAMLHEAMEQQTVSIAKAGIICTLNARTSILAAANPVESRYNPRMSVVENIQLSPTLLSRFDLIYLILDHPNPTTDRRLARHLVSLYSENPPQPAQVSMNELTDYISYAKRHCNPKLTDEASKELVQGYADMRKMSGNKKVITATPRQLESLIRLSEAHARMRLSDTVDRDDVLEAIRLVRVSTQQAATDPTTGTIDMELITTGMSAASRDRKADLARKVKDLLESRRGGLSISNLMKELEKDESGARVEHQDLRAVILDLEQEGTILKPTDKQQTIRLR